MARPRLELQALLASLAPNVYFQPPNNLKLKYPCIIYVRDDVDTTYADNRPYRLTKRYQITVIDQHPDSVIPDKVAELPTASFNRFFTADGLNHDVYTLHF